MDNTALSALWISQTLYHIGIYMGWKKFIDWNSWTNTNKVFYSKYRKKWFVWWVMPYEIWDKSKVKVWKPIPWAIVVFARWLNNKYIERRKAALKALWFK
jgi:hypothetical protein